MKPYYTTAKYVQRDTLRYLPDEYTLLAVLILFAWVLW